MQECKTTVQRTFKDAGPLPLVVPPLADREHALSRQRQNKLGCLRDSARVRGASMIFSCSEIQSAKMRHFYFPANLVVARHTYFLKKGFQWSLRQRDRDCDAPDKNAARAMSESRYSPLLSQNGSGGE